MTEIRKIKTGLVTSINILEDIIDLTHKNQIKYQHDDEVSQEWKELHEKIYTCWNQMKYLEVLLHREVEPIPPPQRDIGTINKFLDRLRK